jgi:hypothetical protein
MDTATATYDRGVMTLGPALYRSATQYYDAVAIASVSTTSGAAIVIVNPSADQTSKLLHVDSTIYIRYESKQRSEANKQLNKLRKLQVGWDGEDTQPPNDTAYTSAYDFLDALEVTNQRPDKIGPSSENGITFYFYSGKNYAMVEFLNSGEIAALFKDRVRGQRQIIQIEEDNDEDRMHSLATDLTNFLKFSLHESSPATL